MSVLTANSRRVTGEWKIEYQGQEVQSELPGTVFSAEGGTHPLFHRTWDYGIKGEFRHAPCRSPVCENLSGRRTH